MGSGVEPRHLFVYGLLRSDVGGPMQPALAQSASLVGAARWRGHLYRVDEHPAAVASDSDEWVAGELYELPEQAGDLLSKLDAYEGVPEDYVRIAARVDARGASIVSWIYVWNRPVRGLPRIRSGDFAEKT